MWHDNNEPRDYYNCTHFRTKYDDGYILDEGEACWQVYINHPDRDDAGICNQYLAKHRIDDGRVYYIHCLAWTNPDNRNPDNSGGSAFNDMKWEGYQSKRPYCSTGSVFVPYGPIHLSNLDGVTNMGPASIRNHQDYLQNPDETGADGPIEYNNHLLQPYHTNSDGSTTLVWPGFGKVQNGAYQNDGGIKVGVPYNNSVLKDTSIVALPEGINLQTTHEYPRTHEKDGNGNDIFTIQDYYYDHIRPEFMVSTETEYVSSKGVLDGIGRKFVAKILKCDLP